jgi:hypothetical protein
MHYRKYGHLHDRPPNRKVVSDTLDIVVRRLSAEMHNKRYGHLCEQPLNIKVVSDTPDTNT